MICIRQMRLHVWLLLGKCLIFVWKGRCQIHRIHTITVFEYFITSHKIIVFIFSITKLFPQSLTIHSFYQPLRPRTGYCIAIVKPTTCKVIQPILQQLNTPATQWLTNLLNDSQPQDQPIMGSFNHSSYLAFMKLLISST